MPSSLQVDVYVAPAIRAETGLEEPSKQLWSPICCTSIQGPTSAVLVDTPNPVELAQGLSEWVKKAAPGKKLPYIYTTHAHGDHFCGNPVLLKNFPEAKCVATSFVNQGIEEAVCKESLDFWNTIFPDGQIPTGQNCPGSLPANDTNSSSFLHVPAIDLVVAGDIVYGECFQYFGEACTTDKRRHWPDALSQIAQLKPSMMTHNYIMAFEDDLKKWNDPAKNDFILDRSCMASVAEKLQANEKASI
ncbi:beta-lactamase-like protein [Aspergillus sergii]|uniref:Beta-lactamase-like protein n=1 Tax=Aspergillus sergii TaxID=1034303 RepID=A0A5N6X3N0_9EURO|nr:beta-lactamase-like protein [Aspergillus sergii]